ncbi:MAG: DUF2846 domain-containing protein [Xanthobacteraceae bacterium]|jgi:hypothetical protein
MRLAGTITIGLCLLWFAPCALAEPATLAATVTTAPAAKPPAHAGGQATIYFIRPREFTAAAFSSLDLIVDGHKIGELPTASYFIARRPPGHHTVAMEAGSGIFHSSWQSDPDLGAGQTYFLQIGPRLTGAIGSDIANMILAGTSVQPLPGTGSMNFVFFSLDAETGHTRITTLKNVTKP